MATKRPARASPELREAPLSPRYHPELHHPMGHCFLLKPQDQSPHAQGHLSTTVFKNGIKRSAQSGDAPSD